MADLETLLAPISGESPTGLDLRDQPSDLTFQEIGQERTEVAPEEDPGGVGHEPNWQAIAARCEEALARKSKDLQLAVWLAEALSRVQGLEGLHTGLRVVAELMERHWDRLHPGYGGDGGVDLAVRARPLSWLGSSKDFLAAVASSAIVPANEAQGGLSWQDYLNSQLVDGAMGSQARFEALKAAGYFSGDEWRTRFGALGGDELRALVASVERCQQALEELRARADKRFQGDEAPNFVGLAELLYDMREYVAKHVPAEEPAAAAGAATPEAGAAAAGPAARPLSGGPLATRDDALKRLSEVAEFFRRTEPHSPVSFLVERAARWGRMPLLEVLGELLEDQNVLNRVQTHLGVKAGEKK